MLTRATTYHVDSDALEALVLQSAGSLLAICAKREPQGEPTDEVAQLMNMRLKWKKHHHERSLMMLAGVVYNYAELIVKGDPVVVEFHADTEERNMLIADSLQAFQDWKTANGMNGTFGFGKENWADLNDKLQPAAA